MNKFTVNSIRFIVENPIILNRLLLGDENLDRRSIVLVRHSCSDGGSLSPVAHKERRGKSPSSHHSTHKKAISIRGRPFCLLVAGHSMIVVGHG